VGESNASGQSLNSVSDTSNQEKTSVPASKQGSKSSNPAKESKQSLRFIPVPTANKTDRQSAGPATNSASSNAQGQQLNNVPSGVSSATQSFDKISIK